MLYPARVVFVLQDTSDLRLGRAMPAGGFVLLFQPVDAADSSHLTEQTCATKVRPLSTTVEQSEVNTIKAANFAHFNDLALLHLASQLSLTRQSS